MVYGDATGDSAPAFVLMSWHSPGSRAARRGRLHRSIGKECHHDRQDHAERQRNPPGKVADAELHFTDGPLDGLKLVGFAIWERRGGGGRCR